MNRQRRKDSLQQAAVFYEPRDLITGRKQDIFSRLQSRMDQERGPVSVPADKIDEWKFRIPQILTEYFETRLDNGARLPDQGSQFLLVLKRDHSKGHGNTTLSDLSRGALFWICDHR